MYASQAIDVFLNLLEQQKQHDRKIWRRSSVDQLAKFLRDNGFLPSGPRGIYAPHVDAIHVSNLLIALLVCEQPGESPNSVSTYAPLKPTDGDSETFREFLARTISDPYFAATIESVSVSRTFARAVAKIQAEDEAKTIVFAADGTPKTGGLFDLTASLSGGFLSQAALEVAHLQAKHQPWSQAQTSYLNEYKEKLKALGVEDDGSGRGWTGKSSPGALVEVQPLTPEQTREDYGRPGAEKTSTGILVQTDV